MHAPYNKKAIIPLFPVTILLVIDWKPLSRTNELVLYFSFFFNDLNDHEILIICVSGEFFKKSYLLYDTKCKLCFVSIIF